MNDFIVALSLFLQTAVQMGTPILFGTLGGMLCEKTGHLNLGIEGMMLMGAVIGFTSGASTGSAFLAVVCAGLAGAVGALIYAVVTVTFRGNQVVTGLSLTIFGTGVSSFIGNSLTGVTLPETVTKPLSSFAVPVLCDIPILGKMIFSQSIYIYIGLLLAVAMHIVLKRTRTGLNIRSIGEYPAAADASGINVDFYKYICITIGGFMCGMGGAYLSLVFVPRWQDEITSGIGWIAVALIIFSTWKPLRAIFGAYLFGALRGIGFKLQQAKIIIFGSAITIPSQLLDMIPYLATIIVIIMITIGKKRDNDAPHALGEPYFREER